MNAERSETSRGLAVGPSSKQLSIMQIFALEAGNSAAMIFKHYQELVRPAAAMEWFGIEPE